MDSQPRRVWRQAGLSDAALDQELRSGRFVAVHRGVLAPRPVEASFPDRCRAAVQTQQPGRAWVGTTSAAALHRLLWVPSSWSEADRPVQLTVPRDATTDHRDGVRLSRALIHGDEHTEVDGVPVCSIARTLVDLARVLPRQLAVILMDGALHARACTLDELRLCLSRQARQRGIVGARVAVDLADGGSESPPETVARLILVDAGVCRPIAGYELYDADGFLAARGDLCIPELLIWLEYDGYLEHIERGTFRNDRLRDRWIEGRGWQVLRFSDIDIRLRRPLINDVTAAIRNAPARIAALDPRRSPEVAAARRALGL